MKYFLKYKILKPIFCILYKCYPEFAVNIRNSIYKFVHYLKNINRNNITKIYPKKDIVVVDCSITSNLKFTTGIQRVVKNIILNIEEGIVLGKQVGDKYCTDFQFYKNILGNDCKSTEYIIDLKNVKKLILLDSSWEKRELFEKNIANMNSECGETFGVIYDLLPIRHSEFFDAGLFIDIFVNWHNMILSKTNHVICISKAVADDVIEYYRAAKITRDNPLAISYFPLGADLPTVKLIKDKFIRNKIKNFVSDKTFLMVGTIEPRKGHLVALEAFTKRLDAGDDIKLLIIGRNGWKNEEFINLLNSNKYYGKNILWIDDANDVELAWSYQHACCLIAASKDEGYGLPLVEAAHYGVPIICSDIPVFREVAQGHAEYFKVWDSSALAETITNWLVSEVHPDSKNIKIYSWAEATKIFMEIVNGEREPYKIIK